MSVCPSCGEKCGRQQRVCRECGHNLDLRRGVLSRVFAWLGAHFSVNRERDAASAGISLHLSSGETQGRISARPGQGPLPPELSRVLARAEEGDTDLVSVHTEKTVVSSSGPVTVTQDGRDRTYSSIDQAPPHLRDALEQAMRTAGVSGGISVNINGEQHTYASWDDMPPDVRRLMDAARRGQDG